MKVAAAGLTASALAIVPVVRSTLVAVVASHVFPASAGSRLPVTVTLSVAAVGLDGAGGHTGAA